jgi:hypothetical protein
VQRVHRKTMTAKFATQSSMSAKQDSYQSHAETHLKKSLPGPDARMRQRRNIGKHTLRNSACMVHSEFNGLAASTKVNSLLGSLSLTL